MKNLLRLVLALSVWVPAEAGAHTDIDATRANFIGYF